MVVRADSTAVPGAATSTFHVSNNGSVQSATVARGDRASVNVEGSRQAPPNLIVTQGSITVASRQFSALCPPATGEALRDVSKFVPLTPFRARDTRPDTRISYPLGKPTAGRTVYLPLIGLGMIPPEATAVAINITASESEGAA